MAHELTGFQTNERGSVRWICACSLVGAGRATEDAARQAWERHSGGDIAYRVEHGMAATTAVIPARPLQPARPACSGCASEYNLTRCGCGRSWCKDCGACRPCAASRAAA